MKHRTLIGFAIFFLLCGTFGLCYVATNTSPHANSIWWGIRFHQETVFVKPSPIPTDPKKDSCINAIQNHYNRTHRIKTIEEK